MTVIDSGACRTSGGAGQAAATQASNGSCGSFQDRADALVRATVLSDLGQSAGHGRHSHGIQGVAAAVRKVLSAQDVTGTDAADDVLKKIETSLHKAAQALADRGVDAKTIDATLDKFRAQLANALDGMSKGGSGGANAGGSPGAGNSTGGSSKSAGSVGTVGTGGSSGSAGSVATVGTGGSSASGGAVSSSAGTAGAASTGASSNATSVSTFVSREVRKERGAIDLVTAEGDHVSIRFRSKDVVTSSAAQATSADGTTVSAAKVSAFSRGGVKIEVDGDLNDKELAAIGDLLGKIDDVATQFFSGDVQAAFSAASSLGVDSDQIAGYRLNLTYSRKIATYGAVAMTLPATAQAPTGTSGGSSMGAANGSASAPASTSAVGTPASANGAAAAGASTPTAATTDASSGGAETPTAADASGTGTPPAQTTDTSNAGATDSTATSGTASASAAPSPPAATPSAQKTLIDFISDTLSKLGSANGAGRVSFSMHWKVSALVTALESIQPAQPTTPADQAAASNTQLFGDSLHKIAAA